MPYPTDLTDKQWRLLKPVLGVGGSRGPQPTIDRRLVVDAILYQARTGCQWRYLPAEFGSWNTIWKTFARWRDRGVWQQAMDVLRRCVRRQHGRMAEPSMVMVDCQVTKGGRAGPSFHQQHGKYRLNGAKRVIAVDYLGLPVGARVVGARRHEVAAAQDLLDVLLPHVPRVAMVLAPGITTIRSLNRLRRGRVGSVDITRSNPGDVRTDEILSTGPYGMMPRSRAMATA